MATQLNLDDTFLMQDAVAPPTDPDFLQLARFQDYSYVAGPGRRCVVWVSGCLRRCPGCFQPQFFDFKVGERVAVTDLADRILQLDGIDGISLSGGEPFEQSAPLATLCRLIKASSDLSILAYTGYRRQDLASQPEQYAELLEQIDLLIDGEYREDLQGPYLWRGSSNQTVHGLRQHPDEPPVDLTEPGPEQIQLEVTDSRIVLTGFPGPDVEEQLTAALASRGILLNNQKHHA